MPTKKQVVERIKFFEERNGSINNFNLKEIIIMLHNETQNKIGYNSEKIDAIAKKIEKQIEEAEKRHNEHVDWSQENLKNGYKVIAEHEKLFEKIFQILPEKGFCEKVTTCLFPDKDIPLTEKVNLLWNDRRWLKGILYFLTAIGLGNIFLVIGRYIVTGAL